MPVELSVITPLLNEEENVYELYNRTTAVLKQLGVSYEIILIDDGSPVEFGAPLMIVE